MNKINVIKEVICNYIPFGESLLHFIRTPIGSVIFAVCGGIGFVL